MHVGWKDSQQTLAPEVSHACDPHGTLAAARAASGWAAAPSVGDGSSCVAQAAIERVLVGRGAIDVLVNNAAVTRDETFPLMAVESWEQVLATNLGGAFLCTRAAVRSMMARRRGAVVNIASLAGPNASPGQ